MYKLKKMFTSRDGKLEVDDREYGIDQEGLDEIGDAKPHMGGATHIFVKSEGGPSNSALFTSRDGKYQIEREEKEESGWANFNIEHGSGYKPEVGEVGWWSTQIANAPSEVVEGLGLPHSWHVSHFVVFIWDEEGEETPEEPGEPENPPVEEPPTENSVWVTVYVGEKIYGGWIEPIETSFIAARG